MTTTPSASFTTVPSNAVAPLTNPPSLSPDAIDTLPALAEILSRLSNLSPSSLPTDTSTPSQNGAGTLSTKEVPAATDGLKHKIQKARQQVKELPDIGRSVEDQEEEIRELEERIKKQRECLNGLREVGREIERGREGKV
ncbi:RNA polymerase II transcription mediator complex subunit 9-domain-containing protein [Bisporella sp. PMI_857]|nr:RNA polymerase II transcription mediator complex subunit 9-domain-containing protein [Bisporella sp. PMI_857]